MKGQSGFNQGTDVVLVVEVAAINSTTTSGQSEWDEINVTCANGKRGIIRIERTKPPIEEPVRRIRL